MAFNLCGNVPFEDISKDRGIVSVGRDCFSPGAMSTVIIRPSLPAIPGRSFFRSSVTLPTCAAWPGRDDIQPVVTVGHSPYADPTLVAQILGVYLPSFPTLRLRIESMFAQELTHGVLSSELDLALISDPLESPRLTQVQIASHPLCAVMQADHPAALKPQVEMADFGGVGWIVFGRKSHPGIYDRLMKEARLANVSPVELHHYVSPGSAGVDL